jgi:outer membrane protein OmpA-like peptidoglycan-associated protein
VQERIVKISNVLLKPAAILAISLAPALGAWAQTSSAPPAAASPAATGANGVSHTTKAMNYRRSGGSAKVSFEGTKLMPTASGEAEVKAKNNRTEIEAKFGRIDDATKFGLQYLTYVFWAVSPQGRAENLGEITLKNGLAEIKADTDMQTFGMIVTAEPYFAVTQPGSMVVLENSLSTGASGKVEDIDATYELLGPGAYSSSNTKIDNAIFGIDRTTPLELFEARNAVRVAHNANADKYAPAAWAKAQQQLAAAEDTYRQKRDRKLIDSASREAAQTAEESRVMAVKQKAEEDAQAKIAAEKQAAIEREAKARADAMAEVQRRQQADQARQQAEQARQQADQARLQAEQAKAEAERMKQEAQQAAQEAARQQQQAESARQAALVQQQAAENQAQQAAQARAAAEAETAKARQSAAQAEAEKAQLRAQLLQQFNAVLQTRDSARGLIVNMSDVLFDTGSSTLKPGAREKLAKISGILLAHPGLTLQVEGHTDGVGSDEFNQELSGRRADAVRDYLAEEGVPASTITAKGFGKTQPVATNDTAEGRQRNRRVELVVNGAAIGNSANAAPGANPAGSGNAAPAGNLRGVSASNQPN